MLDPVHDVYNDKGKKDPQAVKDAKLSDEELIKLVSELHYTFTPEHMEQMEDYILRDSPHFTLAKENWRSLP